MKPKNNSLKRWSDIDFQVATKAVYRMQCRIFDAETDGDTKNVHKLQNRLIRCFQAKALAVRTVSEINRGKSTPGLDGMASLSNSQKLAMVSALSIGHRPSAVKRVEIPKPGKKETRPLGIPNMIDRAHQALIKMALEPQWEARFPATMFGFRKGRGTKDAIAYTQLCLRKSPRWVLDADIEKFFDNIDHAALMHKIDAPENIRQAIRAILQAGISANGEVWNSEEGTPQGGPLSPLLANIAMAGLPDYIDQQRKKAGIKTGSPIRVVIYADDMVALNPDRSTIEWCQARINDYLSGLGLRLSPTKTRICHTLEGQVGRSKPGFDFLGVHFQHHMVNRKNAPGKSPYLLATPTKAAQARFLKECKDIIDRCIVGKKHKAARHNKAAKGETDPVSVMIHRLNRKIRGWTNYYKGVNSKKIFSRIDHMLFNKVWKWAKRQFKGKNVKWRKDRMFSGKETDRYGNPLKRVDGSMRERDWAFKSPFVPNDSQHVTLIKAADTRVGTHTMIRMGARFYDGNWPYWSHRQENYPGTPTCLNKAALKRQKGKCQFCKDPFEIGQKKLTNSTYKDRTGKERNCVAHHNCAPSLNETSASPSVRSLVQAQCAETRLLGFNGASPVKGM